MVKELNHVLDTRNDSIVRKDLVTKPIWLSPGLMAKNAIRASKAMAFAVVYGLTGKFVLTPFSTYLIHQYGYWKGLGIINMMAMALTVVALMANGAFPAKPVESAQNKKSVGFLGRIKVVRWSAEFLRRHWLVRNFLLGVWFGPPLTQVVYRGLHVEARRMVAMSIVTSIGFCLVWYSIYGGIGTVAWEILQRYGRHLPFS